MDETDVFVAHATADLERAKALAAALEARGLRVFLAVGAIEPGARWAERIREAQRRSRATVVCVSVASSAAHYLTDEIQTAIALHRAPDRPHRVMPVYLDGFPGAAHAPYGLGPFQAIDATTAGFPDGVAASIAAALGDGPAGTSPAAPSTRGAAGPRLAPAQPAFVLGEAGLDAVGTPAAVVCLIADRPAALADDLADAAHRTARRPDTEASVRSRLRSEGFDLARDGVTVQHAYLELLATAPMRAYVALGRRTADATASGLRRRLLEGLLATRLRKRDQQVVEVRYRQGRKADSIAATRAAWAQQRGSSASPTLLAEDAGPGSLVSVADTIAALVVRAAAGDGAALARIRLKVVHIWDDDARTNHGVADPFP